MERGQPVKKRIPVILDTDIGNDIDDTWALVFALLRDELDIRLVTTVLGDPIYSAKLVAKLTGVCEKAPIDIGLGKRGSEPARYQGKWVADYDLASYRWRSYTTAARRSRSLAWVPAPTLPKRSDATRALRKKCA